MSIYYVHAPDLSLVKIGFSENPRSRLVKLQSDSPALLVLVAIEGGGLDHEAVRHEQFAEYRRRGEWFEFAPPIVKLVAEIGLPGNNMPAFTGELDRYLVENRITETAFAMSVGVDQSTINRLRNKRHVPSRKLMTLIFEKTGGAVRANDFFDLPVMPRSEAA